MKKLILVLTLLLIPSLSHASACVGDCSTTNNTYNTYNRYINKTFKEYINETTNDSYYSTYNQKVPNEYGIKIDAPYLVEMTGEWYLGIEGGKNLYNTASDEGWFGYGKVTFLGTLFSFKK